MYASILHTHFLSYNFDKHPPINLQPTPELNLQSKPSHPQVHHELPARTLWVRQTNTSVTRITFHSNWLFYLIPLTQLHQVPDHHLSSYSSGYEGQVQDNSGEMTPAQYHFVPVPTFTITWVVENQYNQLIHQRGRESGGSSVLLTLPIELPVHLSLWLTAKYFNFPLVPTSAITDVIKKTPDQSIYRRRRGAVELAAVLRLRLCLPLPSPFLSLSVSEPILIALQHP